MANEWDALEDRTPQLRPVARWIVERDEAGRGRLAMVWAAPDPDAALPALATTEA